MTRVYAVRVHELGGPEQLRYERVEVGDPAHGEARVRHTVIGLNFTDIHFRTDRYPLPSLPHVIGMEAAGVVEAVGNGATAFRVGDRVAYVAETSLQCLKRRDLAVFYGSAGGVIPPFDLWRLNRMGSLYVTYAGLADYLHDHAEMDQRAADLFAMMNSGEVKVPIHKRYPLADAARARRSRRPAHLRRLTPDSVTSVNWGNQIELQVQRPRPIRCLPSVSI